MLSKTTIVAVPKPYLMCRWSKGTLKNVGYDEKMEMLVKEGLLEEQDSLLDLCLVGSEVGVGPSNIFLGQNNFLLFVDELVD